jgi:hypothetical protein
MDLSKAVFIGVSHLQTYPPLDDDEIISRIERHGIDRKTAISLVQFLPIAFTRFLYRGSGIRFPDHCIFLDEALEPFAERNIYTIPAYVEGWKHCEWAFKVGEPELYFEFVAARSAGFQLIQDFIKEGKDITRMMMSPPMMME